MEALKKLVIPAAAIVAFVSAASMLSDAIKHQDQPDNAATSVGRYSLQQTFTDGWLIFDSANGRMCNVPNAQAQNQIVSCTNAPAKH